MYCHINVLSSFFFTSWLGLLTSLAIISKAVYIFMLAGLYSSTCRQVPIVCSTWDFQFCLYFCVYSNWIVTWGSLVYLFLLYLTTFKSIISEACGFHFRGVRVWLPYNKCRYDHSHRTLVVSPFVFYSIILFHSYLNCFL